MSVDKVIFDNEKVLQRAIDLSQGGFVFSEPFLHDVYAHNSNDIITHCDIFFILAPNEMYKLGFTVDRFEQHNEDILYYYSLPSESWVEKLDSLHYFKADTVKEALIYIQENFTNILTDSAFSQFSLCDNFEISLENDYLTKDWNAILKLHESYNLKNSLEQELPHNNNAIKRKKI